MEAIADNPELAQDIIQLLHNKLRREREEQQTLLKSKQDTSSEALLIDISTIHWENEKLEEELTSLRLRLSAARDNEYVQDNSLRLATTPQRRQRGGPEPPDAVGVEVPRSDAGRLQSKLDKYSKRYREAKAEAVVLSVTLAELQRELEVEQEAVRDGQARVLGVEAELQGLHEGVDEFEPTSFLSLAQRLPGLRGQNQLKSFIRSQSFSKLPPVLADRFPVNILALPKAATTWSSDGLSRCVYMTYSRRYDPTAEAADQWTGDNIANAFTKDMDRPHEILFQRCNKWYYYGTYRCAGHNPQVTVKEARRWSSSGAHHALSAMTPGKDHVAPVVFDFINSANGKNGPWPVQFVGLERVGFNEDLYDALFTYKEAVKGVNPPKNGKDNLKAIARKAKSKGSSKGGGKRGGRSRGKKGGKGGEKSGGKGKKRSRDVDGEAARPAKKRKI
ncbi:hypothetical protein C8Q77DRAFT_1080481 [Trametes polyzona]|nr:hypothetical protein C8Q77DRAFT_1080481 [Trametes polyzona]